MVFKDDCLPLCLEMQLVEGFLLNYVALKITLLQMTEKEPCAKCFLCFYGHVLNY